MNEKKLKGIAKELRYAAFTRCRVFLFSRVAPPISIDTETTERKPSNITVTEIGGGVEFTPDDFSCFDPSNLAQKHMIDQLSIVLDSIAISAFKLTLLKAVPVNLSPFTEKPKILPNSCHVEISLDTDGVPSMVATANMNSNLCDVIADYMEKAPAPYFDAGYYLGLGSVKLLRSIKKDPRHKFPCDFLCKGDVHYNGEAGRSGRIRWVEIPYADHLSNQIGAKRAFGEGVVFGENGIIAREVVPIELRIIGDGVIAWCGIIACGLAPNATVIHITSAEEVTND